MEKKSAYAQFLSTVLNPHMLSMLAVILLALYSPYGDGSLDKLEALALGLVLLTIAPLSETLGDVFAGRIHLPFDDREKRNEFYEDWVFFFGLAVLAFWFLGATTMFALSLVFAETNALMWLMNKYWTKVSLHSAAVTGFTSSVIMVLGAAWWWVYLLVLPVWWARLKLKAHDWTQVIAGSAAGWIAAYVTYGFFFGSAF